MQLGLCLRLLSLTATPRRAAYWLRSLARGPLLNLGSGTSEAIWLKDSCWSVHTCRIRSRARSSPLQPLRHRQTHVSASVRRHPHQPDLRRILTGSTIYTASPTLLLCETAKSITGPHASTEASVSPTRWGAQAPPVRLRFTRGSSCPSRRNALEPLAQRCKISTSAS